MGKALDHFYRILKKKTGEEIGVLIDRISQNFLFTTIYIGDELNAYRVFETLNSRGARLSSGDLLKNYLFSLIDQSNETPDEVLNRLEETWEQIGNDIGNNHYTDYIICQWNSTHRLVRKTALFKSIRGEIKEPEQADDYLNQLSQNSQLYAALFNHEHEFWKDHPDYISIKNDLYFFNLFHLRQMGSLLFTAYLNHKNDFPKILGWIKVFSLRYNMIGGHLGRQEEHYNKISLRVTQGCSLKEIKEEIYQLYPSDELFEQAFINKALATRQSKKKARYLRPGWRRKKRERVLMKQP